jgi:MATE family multidrug resistance protein
MEFFLIQVGNALGANKKRLAIELSHTSLGIILALEICIIGPLILWQGPSFVAVFTEDPEVKLLASKTVHLLAFLVVGDGMQGVAGGILRGAGKQLTGAVTNVFCYYCLGLPVAWFLCFHNDMGVGGLLLGISLGAATQCVVLVCLVLFRESWMFEPVESCTIKGTPQSSRTVDFTEGDVNSIILTDRELELVRMLEQNDLNP